jgi:DnaK suppressor protein
MARRDALLRLHKALLARRSELRKRLGMELSDLRKYKASDSTGDSADLAFDSGSEEVSTQLAELEARELNQVERSLARLKQGTYGICEGCQKKIPVTRLNALPYSTTCIECQREMETTGDWPSASGSGSWDKVSDADAHLEDNHDIDLSDIELDLSSNRKRSQK